MGAKGFEERCVQVGSMRTVAITVWTEPKLGVNVSLNRKAWTGTVCHGVEWKKHCQGIEQSCLGETVNLKKAGQWIRMTCLDSPKSTPTLASMNCGANLCRRRLFATAVTLGFVQSHLISFTCSFW